MALGMDDTGKQEAEDTKQGKMGRNRRNNWESGMEVMLAGRERGKMGHFGFRQIKFKHRIVLVMWLTLW